ncbi:CASP-like protein [Carex littledalei]|uniref:CASP-like protein n=1 Tax=Carex littledalei TaxID=544730 RepID=A0A833RJ06_9POAL|nr:CASP-like protein [Carex littledalei]
MAADRTKGWDGDSYQRYEEYRFVLTVNVITFVYSSFQLFTEIHRVITMKHLIRPPLSYYVDLTMDQILAYLLMSSSSVAASHNDIWVSRFGGDEFTKKINASVAMSFLAFIALALSSVISTYVLFRWLA